MPLHLFYVFAPLRGFTFMRIVYFFLNILPSYLSDWYLFVYVHNKFPSTRSCFRYFRYFLFIYFPSLFCLDVFNSGFWSSDSQDVVRVNQLRENLQSVWDIRKLSSGRSIVLSTYNIFSSPPSLSRPSTVRSMLSDGLIFWLVSIRLLYIPPLSP